MKIPDGPGVARYTEEDTLLVSVEFPFTPVLTSHRLHACHSDIWQDAGMIV